MEPVLHPGAGVLAPHPLSVRTWTTPKRLGGCAVMLLALLPLLPVPESWFTQLNYIGLYALVVMGLVLLTGVGGLTSFGQAGFVGIGAYSTALLTTQWGVSPWLALAVGIALTCLGALVVGWITLRMSGHYLPLATMAWCLALNFGMMNMPVLGKSDGLLGIPALQVLGVSLMDSRAIFYLIWVVALACACLLLNLLDSRPGRAIRTLNGGVTMAEAMGISTFRYKMVIFMLAAVLAAISGWLFAHLQRTINPSPFGIKLGMEYLFMAVIGGVGSVWGAFAGAAVFKLTESGLQTGLSQWLGSSGNFEMIVFGVLLVVVLKFVPEGLWPALVARVSWYLPKAKVHRDWAQADALPVRTQPVRGTPLLEVLAVRKQFGGLVAVNDVSFSVRAGEIVGLIGPNGAGKSTTFNLVSGMLPLSGGAIRFGDEWVTGSGARQMAQLGMARTFQHVKMMPDMTVLENVALGTYMRTRSGSLRAMFRLDRTDERRAFKEAERQLAHIGMADQMDELAGNLAMGPQRLMEIARALCTDPVLLLLDEPAAGLRHKEKRALAAVLQQLKREGVTLLLVEHDMEFLMNLTDRIVVMEFGTKLIEGSPADVRASPVVRAAYLGAEH